MKVFRINVYVKRTAEIEEILIHFFIRGYFNVMIFLKDMSPFFRLEFVPDDILSGANICARFSPHASV